MTFTTEKELTQYKPRLPTAMDEGCLILRTKPAAAKRVSGDTTQCVMDVLRAAQILSGDACTRLPGRQVLLRQLRRMGRRRDGEPDTWKAAMNILRNRGQADTVASVHTVLVSSVGELLEHYSGGARRGVEGQLRRRKQANPRRSLFE